MRGFLFINFWGIRNYIQKQQQLFNLENQFNIKNIRNTKLPSYRIYLGKKTAINIILNRP